MLYLNNTSEQYKTKQKFFSQDLKIDGFWDYFINWYDYYMIPCTTKRLLMEWNVVGDN